MRYFCSQRKSQVGKVICGEFLRLNIALLKERQNIQKVYRKEISRMKKNETESLISSFSTYNNDSQYLIKNYIVTQRQKKIFSIDELINLHALFPLGKKYSSYLPLNYKIYILCIQFYIWFIPLNILFSLKHQSRYFAMKAYT